MLIHNRIHLGLSKLILACRDPKKGEAAKAEILAGVPNANTEIEVWDVDLDHYASVLEFTDRVRRSLSRLDGFIANAGLELERFEKSEDCERTLTVNVISTMLMAYAIIPKLQETSHRFKVQTNLSLVGSLIHMMAPFEQIQAAQQDKTGDVFASLSNPDSADMKSRYPVSKLMQTLCFVGMIEHTTQQGLEGVTINCINPGWCKTSLSRAKEMALVERMSATVFQRTSEQGSRTLVHGVVAGPETHGQYLSECQVKSMSSFMCSQEGKNLSRLVHGDLVKRLEAIRGQVTEIRDRS